MYAGPHEDLRVGIREMPSTCCGTTSRSRSLFMVLAWAVGMSSAHHSDCATMKEAAGRLQQMLANNGITEDEIIADLKSWRRRQA